MKTKVRFISKAAFKNWIEVSNLFAKSLISAIEALKQFNKLDAKERNDVKQSFNLYDAIRRKKIPQGETDSAWELSVMVDTHIIATEHNIDPLAAIMRINSPCKAYERVFIK